MADALTFELVSPERKLASAEADAVTIPGMEGDLTAMADHAPFLTTLRPGLLVVRNGSNEKSFVVTGGFAEISDNTVSVLAELAVETADVNADWFATQIEGAEKALEQSGGERKQAAQQRLNDLITLRDQI